MEMITFEQAYGIVMESAFSTGNELVPFTDSFNRVLAEKVISDIDMPPFTKSSVDGFAYRKQDIANDLEVLETIPAGATPAKTIGVNQCSRIMTGAPVPDGADCVIMIEDTEILPSDRIRFIKKSTKDNIAFRGEDVRKGDMVLNPGIKITPQDIAVIAAIGHTSVTVSKMPRVAVISSGSELVEPDKIPGVSQIRNSNSYQLMAEIERAGATGKYYGIASDDEYVTYDIIKEAISENNIVLITGGVSMGDFDFVPAVLEKAGVRILFTRVAVQPGKPTTFGIHDKAIVFGLPGNPVSSFLQFELLVRPLICKMMGYKWKPLEILLPMKEKFSKKSADRMALIPVAITDDREVIPVEFHGSAHISAMSNAFGIISLPVGIKSIEKGEIVSVRQI
jgi:molybdopterin molybdotransferase